jgi:hypothetical protein
MSMRHNNWLDIFSGFSLAFSLKKILLATCGLFISLAILLMLLILTIRVWPEAQDHFDTLLRTPLTGAQDYGQFFLSKLAAEPLDVGYAYPAYTFIAATALLMLLVWSLFGGAICRIASVGFAKGESCSINDALCFSARKFGSFFWSPLVPMIFVAVLLFGVFLIGLIGRIPVVGPPAMGILSIFAMMVTAFALLIGIMAYLGSAFMWPTIATEGTNSFDAISRSFNYILARPWKFIWCVLMACIHGMACMALVVAFTWVTIKVVLLILASGMGGDFEPIRRMVELDSDGPITVHVTTGMVIAGIALRTVVMMMWGLVVGLLISLKLSDLTVLYFIMRRDVDGTNMSEAFLPARKETAVEAEPTKAESAPAKNTQDQA